ncbi:hypothetical protein BE21_36230 [Sorangium cellulosum]|uniref:Uncharacterized protein n=1 Tax=Sorangium cellulosum TaxID=56 RepID=A0A150TNC4_SORCE|nr:hypothetical protein BE21_36230 [Sorangium cellulosum]
MAGDGKYAILHVPDFSEGMSSYLRIGATPEDDYTWRDETDGNRITTTRGDKIEIIGGTYSMTVLGRREFKASSEVEDGRIKQGGITFQGRSDIELVKGPRGQRRIRETTVKGEVHSTYHGDSYEYHYGGKLASRTGDPNTPTPIEDYPSVMTENPTIVSRTWAKSISSYTGSAKLPVPSIHEETWAEAMVSKTNAKSMTDETTVEGPSKETMKAGSISSTTTVEETISDTTKAGTIKNKTTADKIISETRADTEDEMYGDADSYTQGNSKTVVDGIETTINLGVVNEVVLGAMVEATLGGEATLSVGATVDATVGLEASVSVTATLEASIGPSLSMGPAREKIFLDRSMAAPVRTNIAAVHLLV